MSDPNITLDDRYHRTMMMWIAVAGLLLSLSIAGRVGMIAWPFLNDSGLYAYMGKTVATGGVLYRDFYETKLPGVGLIASVFWRAFGEHWAGYVLAQLALALIAAGFLGRAAFRHISANAGLPTFLFAAVFLNFAWTVYTGFQLETLQAFFEAVAAMAILESLAKDDLSHALVAGLAAGFAAMVKPSGIGIAGAFAIALLVQRKNIWRCLAQLSIFAIGATIPTSLTLLYVFRCGAWPYLPGVIRQIERYADATPMGNIWPLELATVGLLLGFPMVFRVLRSRRERDSASSRSPIIPFAFTWFLIDLAGIILQRRLYPYHFLPLVCPAAILYGLLPWRARPMHVAVGLLPIALFSLRWEGTDLSNLARGFQHEDVSQYVSAHTTPGDSVYTDQMGRLLIETDRDPGSRYGTFFYFVNYDTAPQEYGRGMLADFRHRQPKYILLDSSWNRAHEELARGPILSLTPLRRENFLQIWPEFDQYLRDHYVLETVIRKTNVYRRRPSNEVVASIHAEQ